MLQPLLHDLAPVTAAPTAALGGADGQIRATGVQGVFHADTRVLAQALLRVDGREPEAIGYAPAGPGAARFVSLARWLGDPIPDPTVRIERLRRVVPGGLTEEIRISSTATVPVRCVVTLDVATDNAPIEVVKSGGGPATGDAVTVTVSPAVTVTASPAVTVTVSPERRWEVDLPPRGATTLHWGLHAHHPAAVVAAPDGPVEWARPTVTADDRRLVRLLDQALDDLVTLRLVEPAGPADTFLGAGVPWFLTLFGRDSVWAARMLLPLGTELAGGTLRTLARRQGRRDDARTEEQPGKIMHELRGRELHLANRGITLPGTYYGTVDATPLWISLLHDAWRWGMPPAEVAALLPALSAALDWIMSFPDFVRYVDTTGRGLANQGWKDSGDAVRFRDGRRAEPPIALVEVQGYAYQAAVHGAALLDAFDRPGGDRLREYAAGLAARFRARFWVDGYPALALDRDGRPVDALTSNIGHLLGTGLLATPEEALVARALAAPAMSGGFGLRTMSADDGGFSPLSYHCGSIWAHDTAIVLFGLARSGFTDAAAALADGLLAAGETFGYRLPELYGGDDRGALGRPVPYPAACRPQAWSAAAAVVILQAALGLYPDVPAGRVELRPGLAPLGAVSAAGLRLGDALVNAAVDRSGVPTLDDQGVLHVVRAT
ncbi:glycogen debranching N-terminal domain-containing protein [Actinomycetes bacterium KLBMP 9797]